MTANYNAYTERKLQTILNTTRATLSKLQSEKNRLDKKIESTAKKEAQIREALVNKLMPNKQTAYDLKNPQSVGTYKNFSDFEKELESEESQK